MIAAIAATAAGWLCLYFVMRAGPRLGRASGTASHGDHRPEPPAVVSLIAGRDAREGYKATLLDLAARGWFRLSQPAGLASAGPDAVSNPLAAPVMCVLPAESPIEELTPYERRALTHLAQRAGERGEVPADALADGFEGGEEPFMKAFRGEVLADARARGLTRPAISRAVARWTRVPDFTEFDGQVIRQWETTDGEGGTTQYVAIDDGIRPRAWSFIVNGGAFRQLTPGTLVHAQVNPRRNKLLSVQTSDRPPVAPQLAEVVAAQKRAARGGLPDPACLVTAADAAEILACPVRRCFRDSGRVAEWRPVSARHPVVLVEVNESDTHARNGRQVLGLDAYLLDQASTALACAGATRARIAITGLAPADAEASLLRLLPRVTERLKNAVGYQASSPGE